MTRTRRVGLLALTLAAAASVSAAVAQPPTGLRVFVFSQDSVAGFDDEPLDLFRREITSHLGDVMELAYGRDDAEIAIQYLGRGELTLAFDAAGDTAQHLFRIDEEAPRMWVLLRVRTYTKPFSLEGRGARDTARLARTIAEWVRSHRTELRKLLMEPGG